MWNPPTLSFVFREPMRYTIVVPSLAMELFSSCLACNWCNRFSCSATSSSANIIAFCSCLFDASRDTWHVTRRLCNSSHWCCAFLKCWNTILTLCPGWSSWQKYTCTEASLVKQYDLCKCCSYLCYTVITVNSTIKSILSQMIITQLAKKLFALKTWRFIIMFNKPITDIILTWLNLIHIIFLRFSSILASHLCLVSINGCWL